MKAGIVGAGAMGTLFSDHFSRNSIDLVVYEKSHTRVEQLDSRLHVSTEPSILSDRDVIFIFVKSYATEQACTEILPHVQENVIIVTLQNGLGNFEILQTIFTRNPVVAGVTTYGASLDSTGTLVPGGTGEVIIGSEYSSNRAPVYQLLSDSGFNVTETKSPLKVIWEKAIINAGINPIGAILDIPNGKIIENQYTRTIQEQLVLESCNVANALGMGIPGDMMVERARDVCARTATNYCSMLQDIRSNRETEIGSINGKIEEYGKTMGIKTSWNSLAVLFVRSLEIKSSSTS